MHAGLQISTIDTGYEGSTNKTVEELRADRNAVDRLEELKNERRRGETTHHPVRVNLSRFMHCSSLLSIFLGDPVMLLTDTLSGAELYRQPLAAALGAFYQLKKQWHVLTLSTFHRDEAALSSALASPAALNWAGL
eukprot:6311-Heterococcus_DN1.PRE.3